MPTACPECEERVVPVVRDDEDAEEGPHCPLCGTTVFDKRAR